MDKYYHKLKRRIEELYENLQKQKQKQKLLTKDKENLPFCIESNCASSLRTILSNSSFSA